jgi:hypothetical protein
MRPWLLLGMLAALTGPSALALELQHSFDGGSTFLKAGTIDLVRFCALFGQIISNSFAVALEPVRWRRAQ